MNHSLKKNLAEAVASYNDFVTSSEFDIVLESLESSVNKNLSTMQSLLNDQTITVINFDMKMDDLESDMNTGEVDYVGF